MMVLLLKLWCRMFHRKHWHDQLFTDRVRFLERTECWKCGSVQSGYRLCRNQKNPHEESP